MSDIRKIKRKFILDKVRLSIDGSTTELGYAVFKGKKRLKSGMFKCVGSDLAKRIESARLIIETLINEYRVQEVILEDIQLQPGRYKAFKGLAELRGVLINISIRNNCYVYSFKASEWRSVVGIKSGRGYTREKAKEAAKELIKKYNIECETIDEIEAILLMIAFIKNNQ